MLGGADGHCRPQAPLRSADSDIDVFNLLNILLSPRHWVNPR